MSVSNLLQIEKIYSDKGFLTYLLNIAKRYTNNSEQAEDIVQEVFVKSLENYALIHTNIKAYIKVAVIHKLQDWKKAKRVRQQYIFECQSQKSQLKECQLIRQFEIEQILQAYLQEIQLDELELAILSLWKRDFKNQEIQHLLADHLQHKQVRGIKQKIKRKLEKARRRSKT